MELQFRLGRAQPLTAQLHERPLTAAALRAAFDALPEGTWSDPQAAQRIGSLLEHEEGLARKLRGLPGTEHPQAWLKGAEGQRFHAQAERSGRLVSVHLPLWWTLPLTLYGESLLTLTLPLADNREQALALALDHLPRAWHFSRGVDVRLEVQTRVYWGARAVTGVATRPARVAGFSLCTIRSEAVGSTREMFVLDRGRPREGTLGDDDAAPQVQRALRGGMGLLVAVPVLTFERDSRSLPGLLRQLSDLLRRRLGLHAHGDRDPTFADRLRHDEAWWSQALGMPALPWRELNRRARAGGLLRPASLRALRPDAGDAQVVLLHGGLSSARSGFADALPGGAAGAGEAPAALWPGLPALDDACTWRFEHDTFLPVADNVERLRRELRPLLAASREGTLVLVSHSRGGAVARFALPLLRADAPGWRIAALTLAGPHLGTQVFRRIGERWHGLAGAVGLLRDLAGGLLLREQMAELVNLERGLAYQIPQGFRDVEPEGVRRMAGGDPSRLPEGMVLVGSEWGPEGDDGLDEWLWDTLVEDLAGAEVGGDGLVARESSWAGRRLRDDVRSGAVAGAELVDASPAFHTRYLAHARTRAVVQAQLRRWLGRDEGA